MFPRRAALVAALTGAVVYWTTGLGPAAALAVYLTTFLPLGGARYLSLLYRVLPRDVKFVLLAVKVRRRLKYYQDQKFNLFDIFCEVASKHPHKTAIVCVDDGRKWTFTELEKYAGRVACYFSSIGVAKGDVVAVFVENCPEHVGLSLGLWKLGAIAAYINTNLRQSSLLHCLNISNATHLICSTQLLPHVAAIEEQLEERLASGSVFFLGGTGVDDGGKVGGATRGKHLELELENVTERNLPPLQDKSLSDIASYIYTSGTTGLPKACRVPSIKTVGGSCGIATLSHVTSDDIIYNCLPLYHSAGGILALGDMLFLGCTMVLRKKFSASKFFEDCTKYNCTVVQYIGEVCRYLLAQPVRDTDAANPVNIAVGNGLRPEIWNRFQTRFGISRVSEFYAATEGVSASCNHDNKPGAVGHVIISFPFPPSIILVKRDPQTGRYVRDDRGFLVQTGVNEPGELISPVDQSDQFRQYHGYSNRKATENKLIHNVFRQGDTYYKSGDVLRMDEEGYLYFCDRTGDTFRWKGENVSAAEVEGVMQKILGLKDVLVYGVVVRGADGRAGMAAINTNEDSLDISDLYRKLSVELPRYAVPIFIRLTSSVALTSTFKLKKTQAREEGYDLGRASDPLFLLHPSKGRYVRLTPELVLELENGNLKL